MARHFAREERRALRVRWLQERRTCLVIVNIVLQEERRAERQEDRLHNKAVRAALHGNIGRAVVLEVSIERWSWLAVGG